MNTFLNFTPDNSRQKSRYGIDISGLRLYTFVQYYRYVTPVCATFDTGYAASGILKKFYFCNYSKLEYFVSKLFRFDFFYINICIDICRHCLPAFLCSSSYILSRSPAASPNQRTDMIFPLPPFNDATPCRLWMILSSSKLTFKVPASSWQKPNRKYFRLYRPGISPGSSLRYSPGITALAYVKTSMRKKDTGTTKKSRYLCSFVWYQNPAG